MLKIFPLLFFCFYTLFSNLSAEPSLGMAVNPQVLIPLGSKAEYFLPGYGGRLSGLAGLSNLTWLAPRFDLSYSYIPLDMSEQAELSLFQGSCGLQASLTFGERLSLSGFGSAGGYYGVLSGNADGQDMFFCLAGGGAVGFQLFNDVSFSLGAEYTSFVGTFDALSVSLGVTTRLSGSGGGTVPLAKVTPFGVQNLPSSGFVQLSDIQLDAVFPVLLKYYDSHPIGTAVLTNTGKKTIESVEIRTQPANYIDSAKLSARIDKLEPGESAIVDLYVLFNEDILGVSEGAKVITDIRANYKIDDRDGADQETVTLEIHDRNSLSWDEDIKVAAFVTARDEEIQRFSRNIASMGQEIYLDGISQEFQLAMMMYCGMVEQGITYIVDPASSYKDLSENPMVIDFVQFPRQTLYVKAGDCDDLSTTYCALLESVGVESAFITVPGHIYAAFRLKMDKADVRRNFSNMDGFIFRDDGSVWVPVETTYLSEGFVKAWAAGARQWIENDDRGRADFFATSKAWETYKPVAFSVSRIELGTPTRTPVLSRFAKEMDTFITQELYPREQELYTRLKAKPDDPRLLNLLGVLYARYGKYKEAEAQFSRASAVSDYLPAMINLGNLKLLAGDFPRALVQYRKVLGIEQANPTALLGVSRAEFELNNLESSETAYLQLAAVSPELAAKFSYLNPGNRSGTTDRASDDSRVRKFMMWDEGK
jgi:tetratricopeptide (TPR) repeat protein